MAKERWNDEIVELEVLRRILDPLKIFEPPKETGNVCPALQDMGIKGCMRTRKPCWRKQCGNCGATDSDLADVRGPTAIFSPSLRGHLAESTDVEVAKR